MEIDNILAKYTSKRGSLMYKAFSKDTDAIDMLYNIYKEARSTDELLYMCKNNIYNIPLCPTCGKQIKFTKDGYAAHCSNKCTRNDPESVKKYKETCMAKYGCDNPAKSKSVIEHAKQTCESRYGGSTPMASVNVVHKRDDSKRKHGTFNTSLPENKAYILLNNKFKEVVKQYKSDEYPYCCDFYIKDNDTYIECNFHWTHGGKAYDNDSDYEKLLTWVEKSKTSKFYENAIKTWTERDVDKRTTAKNNNINYIEFWNLDELKAWIDSYSI